ncbi:MULTISPECIES: hypothetical protein [unclassified Bradyrhizobium]
MKNFVSIGSVCGQHYVASIENFKQTLLGPFQSAGEAMTIASNECDRLGLPPAYRGIPSGKND